MQLSKIEWTDRTWNPTRGCSRVSEGCRHCWAERDAARKSSNPQLPGYADVARFVQIGKRREPQWTGEVRLVEEKLFEPLRIPMKPSLIFVNSMSDLWHEKLDIEDQIAVYAMMAACRHHTFQVLTKRPLLRQRALTDMEFISRVKGRARGVCERFQIPFEFEWPLFNVWEGVSFENQSTAIERCGTLFRTPASLRFASYEPAIESVGELDILSAWVEDNDSLDWLIIGGESGPGARPFVANWGLEFINNYQHVGRPLFFKQMGSNVRAEGACLQHWGPGVRLDTGPYPHRILLKSRHGSDPAEWPPQFRVRQIPRGWDLRGKR